MSRFILVSSVVKIVTIYFTVASVMSYQNVYDLLEWKQQNKHYEPRGFHGRQRYFAENRHLDYRNPYFSKFGNGYDNLGNGLPNRHFQLFQTPTDGWLFHRQPFRDSIRVDFEDYPQRNIQTFYSKYSPRRHYSNYREYSPFVHEKEFGLRRNTDYAKTNRFLEDNENKNQKKTDEIYMKSQEGVNMDSLKKEKLGEQSNTDQSGENKLSLRSNKVVKKGHTTRGFASHHHKDETGNSTTFFDESSDFGGQSDVRDTIDGFNTRKTLEQITQKEDEKFFKEDGGQEGSFGSGLLQGNQKFEKDFSSTGGHNDFGNQFQTREGEDNLGFHKNYHYLNGERFDFTEPFDKNHY